jgi:hypothetical protein
MIDRTRRLLSPEYLVVADPGPLGGLWVMYVLLGTLFAVVLGMAIHEILKPRGLARWRDIGAQEASREASGPGTWPWVQLWTSLFGLVVVAGRFLGWPGMSARIWPLSLTAIACSVLVVRWLHHRELPEWLTVQLQILTFTRRPTAQPISPDKTQRQSWHAVAGLVLHFASISIVVWGRYGWPLWTAPLVLLALVFPQIPLLLRGRRLYWMPLTPLLGAYVASFIWLLYRGLDITIIGWQGLVFPNPMTSLFYTDGIVLAAVAYAWLCQLQRVSDELQLPVKVGRWAVTGLLAATVIWTGAVYFGKRTHGTTASDPYAYAQMGVDLATRGTFLHRFSLFREVIPLDIAWAPLQPVGYHIPRNEFGDCPSVWATGASVLLAAGYAILGEEGLYITTPMVAILALAATWALVQELLRSRRRSVRNMTAALTVVLVASSPEHVDRLLVPMADAAAQLFTVLTLLLALRGMRALASGQRALGTFFLTGIAFSWAYWVRHTQLVLALPVVLAAFWGCRLTRQNSGPLTSSSPSLSRVLRFLGAITPPLLAFSGAALVAALPDVLYRWRVFGGPFATETTELHLMRLQYMGTVAWQLLRDATAAGEWGYLLPLAVYGIYRLARERSMETTVLGSAFLAVLLVHLTYRSLRLRDLISLFPLLDLAVAYGAVALVRLTRSVVDPKERRLGAALLPAATIAWVVLSLALARWAMLDNLWKPGWASFGYVRSDHRAAFDRIAELTPADSVIGASLNAGAVMLYTGRDAIRPYDSWKRWEWDAFTAAMRAGDRPIYLLDDGGLMAAFVQQERRYYQLTPIEELKVPLFYTENRESGWLYRLEWAE